jgi:hypothetical protein
MRKYSRDCARNLRIWQDRVKCSSLPSPPPLPPTASSPPTPCDFMNAFPLTLPPSLLSCLSPPPPSLPLTLSLLPPTPPSSVSSSISSEWHAGGGGGVSLSPMVEGGGACEAAAALRAVYRTNVRKRKSWNRKSWTGMDDRSAVEN